MLDTINQPEADALPDLPESAEAESNGRRVVMRRAGFGLAGLAAAAGLLSSRKAEALGTPNPTMDAAIFNFALNFEYLGAEYYLRALNGNSIGTVPGVSLTGAGPQGTVSAPTPAVPFQTTALAYYCERLATDEIGHVIFFRQALTAAGVQPIAEPTIDFVDGFAALAINAGLAEPGGPPFNPYANEVNFLLGAYVLEDVCVTALAGAAALLTVPDNIAFASSLLGAEGAQAGAIRGYLAEIGAGAATNAISKLRATLGGTFDNGTDADGNPFNFTNVDYNGQVARRTTSQVLSIAFGNNAPGTNKGGFFPSGVNGDILSV